MDRERWLLVLSPTSVVVVILIIVGLGRKRLFKCLKPKAKDEDEESADILMDDAELAMTKNLPPKQHGKEGKSQTEEFSEPDKKRISLRTRNNNESERRSSPGTGVYPNSEATSYTTSNKKSSVQSDFVNSGLSELQKRQPSKPGAQEMASPAVAYNRTRQSELSSGTTLHSAEHIDGKKILEMQNQVVIRTYVPVGSSVDMPEYDQQINTTKMLQKRQDSRGDPDRSSQRDYEWQDPVKKPRTNVHERDSISYSNELDTSMTSLQSGVQSSSSGKRGLELQNQTEVATYVSEGSSVNMPGYPQQINAIKGFDERQDSTEDPNKSSQSVEYNITKQSDLSSSRAQYSAERHDTPEGYEGQPQKKKIRTKEGQLDSRRHSNELDTSRSSLQSGFQISSDGEKIIPPTFPSHNEVVLARDVSGDYPVDRYQQIDTTTAFEDCREDPYKTSQQVEYNITKQSDLSSSRAQYSAERHDTPEGYDGQPQKKKVRTKEGQLDSRRHSNELDTSRSSLQSGFQISSDGETIIPPTFPSHNEVVLARDVSGDSPVDRYQQIDTTTAFEDCREDPYKTSQQGDYEDLRKRATEADNGHTTWQSDIGMDIDPFTVLDEIGEPERKPRKPRKQTPDWIKKMFVEKIMALDVTARNICSPDTDMDECFDFNNEDSDDSMESDTYNPLDVLCDVLHDSDTFLQQEIVSKMSMLQFALPLLLPDDDNRTSYTFMLWAMRDIVKKWKPQSLVNSTGFEEGNLVNISMPIFSFFRLGTCNLSKSKILNQVLSPPQFIQNYFVHRDMPGGNAQRQCSNGLVEMSCYFPAGRGHSDIFPEPVSFINLRGDLEYHLKQFHLLSGVSSAVFVFIESIKDNQYDLLSKLVSQNPQFFFIVNVEAEKSAADIIKFLQNLSETHNIKKDKFIVKNRKVNDTQLVKTLQSKIKSLLENPMKNSTLEKIAERASESNFNVDENFRGCEKAREAAKTITSQIKNVLDYKKKIMKLQGDLWKQLTKIEKELCRMRNLEDKDVEEYQSQLREDHFQLRKQQRNQKMASGVKQFLDALEKFTPAERKVFLKWLKIQLDKLGRHQLAKLNDEYRELLTDVASNAQAFMEIDQKLADGSLGVEHFIRELGQFYEAEHSIGKIKIMSFSKIAANLLLDGFPLELIDGDASNIPMTWITDVLSELEIITPRNCTVRVITVLGVQSTGKSTLLNTMFGLHLPTSSGRCTRGAFMTLLDAKENFHENLDCDYVMVIDTEGLKSMELASLEGSYEHDNELATVAVGLSDITIVNMAMENTEEMKDILQIVIHAFLRMKEVGKKSSCHFVHQNVSDVSAHVKNRQAREKFLEQLNEMTKVSARMENKSGVNTFSDIIHCDIESNSWYIPGLWHGIPPMASVNYGYSENVQELKKSIEKYLKSMPGKPQDIRQFTEWMRSLWEAVKHEKFVFSFRNRLVTEAYNQLCIQYSDWEWRFQKNSHDWMIKTETLIFNLSSDQLGSKTWDRIKSEMNSLLDKEEHVMARSLEKYFRDDCDNAHLLEMFKSDFFQSIKYLREILKIGLLDKCDLTINIQKEKCQIQAVQKRYIGIIEESVSDIMDKIRKNEYSVDEEQLKGEFEMIWRKATSTLPPPTLKKRDIDLAIIQQLKEDMKCDDNSVFLKLTQLQSLNQYKGEDFSINRNYLQVDSKGESDCAKDLALSIQRKCKEKVTEMANSKTDFNEMYSLELLKMINNNLNQYNLKNLRTTKLFELDLKLWVLGNAVVMFQRMHEEFVLRNDPQSYLEEMKPQYFDTFMDMFKTRNDCQRRAKQLCTVSLTPAILDHINRCLGKEIVDDILQKNGPREFKSRKILQREVLNTLLNDGSLENYAEYINSYEGFMKRWISQYLTEHYKCRNTIRVLQTSILQSVLGKIKQALQDKKTLQAKTIYDFLAEFCNVLKEELVISQNSMKVVIFENNLSTIEQFAYEIESYLSVLEKLVEQDINSRNIETIFFNLTLKPQDELFRKVIGCGKQCPFCKAPCEAGGGNHKEHFASVHRPRGLAQHVNEDTKALDHSICSSNVISNKTFRNAEGKPHPYKDYQKCYPDWAIYPDTTADGSDYWKFVLMQFNYPFAKLYNAKPANLPEDWHKLTREEALKSLNKTQ